MTATLGINEIRQRAAKFVVEWGDAKEEDSEAKPFWIALLAVYGISPRRIVTFEAKIKRKKSGTGKIDVFIPGLLLVEHKSRGLDLDIAWEQAKGYVADIKDDRDLPRWVIVSDFARFWVYDMEYKEDETPIIKFDIKELPEKAEYLSFLAGYEASPVNPGLPVDQLAATKLGLLHDQLLMSGYGGHNLERLLVRLLFCMFAEDSGVFPEKKQFQKYLKNSTREDGSDLGANLQILFQILDQLETSRQKGLTEELQVFPYVNGGLFQETLSIAVFTKQMRNTLLDCCALDWAKISPAIFGALFQAAMDPLSRRNLGAHYTSEKNVLKALEPLFINELWKKFKAINGHPKKLENLHNEIANIEILDPACGCGNFLIVAYSALRTLELEILKAIYKDKAVQIKLDIRDILKIDLRKFHGIEIEEWPARIAEVAMWLVDHQLNLRLSELGHALVRLPLDRGAHIVNGNALTGDWASIVKPSELTYIIGNPPFSGAMVMGDKQRTDAEVVFSDLPGSGVLDFVSCWYWKAAKFIQGTNIKVAFVSTNSIVQGEQVALLWKPLVERYRANIKFAHRTFKWMNEARGKAAVHVVIIGFDVTNPAPGPIWNYIDPAGEGQAILASNINPYLIDAPTVFVTNRDKPICKVSPMRFGSMPRDGGHLILDSGERKAIIKEYPEAKRYIREYLGTEEFLNGGTRYCLWLVGIDPSELKAIPPILERVRKVKAFREASKAEATRRYASIPTLFCQNAHPDGSYLFVPGVSSERREYVPIGFMDSSVITSNSAFVVPNATHYEFGVLSSVMHMAWMRTVCGRLESRYRYSKDVVYNNFPWPKDPSEKEKTVIAEIAKAIIAERARHKTTLSDLYDPDLMPPALVKVHKALDIHIDRLYRVKPFTTEEERVSYLFNEYTDLIADAEEPKLPKLEIKKRKGRL
ncbi:MAG TPA: DNA methyltransferase [bacterium]|jgi:hypothetical protein|nr:DNA methyltransferase [bacterium]